MPSPQVSSDAEVAQATEVLDAVELHGRGLLNARAGEIEAALGYLTAAAAAERELSELQRVTLLSTTLECRLARGEIAEARSVGDRLGIYLERPGLTGATAHHGRGELCAAVDEVDLAAAHFARIPRRLGPADDDPDVIPWRAAAAVAAVRLGHRVEATALAREHLTLAGAAGAPYPVALGLRTLATVDAHTDRASLLRQALAELDVVPAARLEAQIQTDLAGLLMLAGGPSNASESLALLRSAEAYAGHQGLWPLLGRVRRLLTRMGEEPQPVLSETLATLTAAERRVARLAATGLTNRAIADRLVVTVKAVEWHLSHVYRKLGIQSRGALAAALGPGI